MKTFWRISGLLVLLIVVLFIPDGLPDVPTESQTLGCTTMGNPATAYCQTIMGYEYTIITEADGAQNGLCTMPDGGTCDEWDFYSGTCGKAFSWCERSGYTLQTRTNGNDPYSMLSSVCLDDQGRQLGSTAELSGLNALIFQEPLDLSLDGLVQSNLPSGIDRADTPASFDWRNFEGNNWMTPVKTQACGSCWAFATVGVAEAQQNIINRNPDLDPDLSEQYLVSTCFPDGNCQGGQDNIALQFIRDDGIPDEACYPLTGTNTECSGRCTDWASRLKFVPNAYSDTSPSPVEMKYAISHYGPLMIRMGIGDPFKGGFDSNGIYRCEIDFGFNHSIVAVGYDDAGGYWIAKNSYGTGFGDDGYFKIGYGECGVETNLVSWVQSQLPYHEQVFLPFTILGYMQSPQPVLNGGFEQSSAHWVEYSSNGYDLIQPAANIPFTAHSGDWIAYAGGGTNETAQVSQTLTVSASRPVLHFWHWIKSPNTACDKDYFKLYADTTLLSTTPLCKSTETGAWSEVIIDLAAYAGNEITLKFEITTSPTTASYYYLDDISLEAP